MAIVGIHIEKKFNWRGTDEFFENVYHYDSVATLPTDAGWSDLIDAIVSKEKSFHSTEVTFTKARIHGPTNTTKAEDQMIYIKDLTGAGTATVASGMPKELAVVVQIYMGRTPRGYKAFLRKYYHTRHLPNSSGEQAAGNNALAAADRTHFANKFNEFREITIGTAPNYLCKPNGQRIPSGEGAVCLPYLHVRQLKQ